MDKTVINGYTKAIMLPSIIVMLFYIAFRSFLNTNVDSIGGLYFSVSVFIGGIIGGILSTRFKMATLSGVGIYFMSFIFFVFIQENLRLINLVDVTFLIIFCLPSVLGSVVGYYVRKLLKK